MEGSAKVRACETVGGYTRRDLAESKANLQVVSGYTRPAGTDSRPILNLSILIETIAVTINVPDDNLHQCFPLAIPLHTCRSRL